MRRGGVRAVLGTMGAVLALSLSVGTPAAEAASCGGLFQPACRAPSGQLCGGLLQPACPKAATGGGTRTRTACGGLLQPRCPTTGTGTGTRAACGGLLQPRCPTTGTGTGTGTRASCGGLLQPRCRAVTPQCGDGVDNDKDGQRDLLDAGCASTSDMNEYDDLAPDANGQPRGADVDPRTTGRLLGFNSVLGMWSSGVTSDQETELIRAAGGNAQRLGINWSNIEPRPGHIQTLRFTETDVAYAALTSRGMVPILTVMDSPVWASDLASCGLLDFKCREARANPPEHLPPRDIDAYAAFVRMVSDRYPLAAIETWNEPNIQRFWHYSKFPDPMRMATMQCAAKRAVDASDPQRVVTSPGFSFIGSGPASGQIPYVDYVDSLHAHMRGTCWDALSVHLYPTSHVDGDGGSIAQGIRAIKAVRTRAGDTTPIWITETGASTTGGLGGDDGHTQRTEAEQKEMMRWTLNELLTTPEVGAVFLHTLREKSHATWSHSNPAGYQYGFGLLAAEPGPAPSPKPAWCHLVGVTKTAYPGCAAGSMTLRAKRLRSRALRAQRSALAKSRRRAR